MTDAATTPIAGLSRRINMSERVMEDLVDPKRVVADGYDRMGHEFRAWNSERPPEVRRWFLGQVLSRLGEGSTVLEVGCGPGTDAGELSAGRRYVGVDLSSVQLSIARELVPHATFVVGRLHVDGLPACLGRRDCCVLCVQSLAPEGARADLRTDLRVWLRPGGRLMLSLPTTAAEDRVEE